MPLEPVLRERLLRLFDVFAEATGNSVTTIGGKVYGDPRLYMKLKTGSNFTIRNYDRIIAKFNAIWPRAPEWPGDIERVSLEDVPDNPRAPRTPRKQ